MKVGAFMPNHSGFNLPRCPKSMEYRDIVLEVVDINSSTYDSIVFQAFPIKEGVDLLQYVDLMKDDYYFHYLFTCIFGLTARNVDVRFQLNNDNTASQMYVYVKCVLSESLLSVYRSTVPLFVANAGRQTNIIEETTFPFCMNNLTDTKVDDASHVSVHGMLHACLMKVNGSPNLERFMSCYGVSIDIDVANYQEIAERFPNYSVILHAELYDNYVLATINNMKAALKKKLDPGNLMKLEFNTYFINDNRTLPISSLSLKVVFIIRQINGIELYELTNTRMVFRPVRPGTILGNMDDVNWEDAKPYVAQIATALYSDNGTLFIPDIISVDTLYADGKSWIAAYLDPHFAHFTKNKIFYGSADMIQNYMNEFYWLNASMANYLQFIFPTMAELPDPTVLCYGRVMIDFFKKNMERLSAIFTNDQIHIQIVAEVDNWVYFALVDKTMVHDLKTFLQFNEYFLAEISTDKVNTTTSIMDLMMGLFCASDPDTLLSYVPPDEWAKLMGQFNNDELLGIVRCYEISVQMDRRTFWPTYVEVRDRILDDIRKANQKDTDIKTMSTDRDLASSISPTQKVRVTKRLYQPFATPSLKPHVPNLLERLFGNFNS